MNRVCSLMIYEARVSSESFDFTVDLLAGSVPEAYLKLQYFGVPRDEVVDLFPAPIRSTYYDPQCPRPMPTCEVR